MTTLNEKQTDNGLKIVLKDAVTNITLHISIILFVTLFLYLLLQSRSELNGVIFLIYVFVVVILCRFILDDYILFLVTKEEINRRALMANESQQKGEPKTRFRIIRRNSNLTSSKLDKFDMLLDDKSANNGLFMADNYAKNITIMRMHNDTTNIETIKIGQIEIKDHDTLTITPFGDIKLSELVSYDKLTTRKEISDAQIILSRRYPS